MILALGWKRIRRIASWKAIIPIYRASTTILIDAEQSNILFQATAETAAYDQYLQTQIRVLLSRSRGTRVIRALNLD